MPIAIALIALALIVLAAIKLISKRRRIAAQVEAGRVAGIALAAQIDLAIDRRYVWYVAGNNTPRF